ncbi:NnrS family protein [Nitrococcus mobilis]|uniref:Short-chain dehydrogenase n=1 Tax=Nitrococcus mobilis Nb-231 TaxID=314278 RepID=A4BST7_9GAMM|nr:NnrS family protein [Nitrococcus mobilis]EAR21181.1 hypothetical protein NB231_00630 [Nitrococcus mobilis Nb-231]
MLLAYPFRLFFLLTGIFGAVAVLVWLAVLLGWLQFPAGISPPLWHSHEMLYGFVPAAIAGFLLTAMANWTGLPPPSGYPLLALGALWLAGRLAMALTGWLPNWLVAAIDLSFLPTLAFYALLILRRAGNSRNLPLVAVLAVLAAGNVLMHLTLLGLTPTLGYMGELVALDTIAVLMAVIGGRIIPAFTDNWLIRQHKPQRIRRQPRLDQATLLATILMLPADLLAPASLGAGMIALAAGLFHLLRLCGWQGWHTWREPLMWILHVGYAWLALALLLKGLTPLSAALDTSVWYHTLGVGAIGTLIIGVMTRVTVGHTGRPLTLLRGTQPIYWLVSAAAVLRVSATLSGAPWMLYAAALAWVAAFALFAVRYAPILSRPRVDGQPG